MIREGKDKHKKLNDKGNCKKNSKKVYGAVDFRVTRDRYCHT